MKSVKIFSVLFIALCFCSCSTILPLDDSIIEKVGGESQLPNFQYYISRNVVLDHAEQSSNTNLKKGEAKIVNYRKEDQINLYKKTPGVVLDYSNKMGARVLNVAFEAGDSKYLQFAKTSKSKYYYIKTVKGKQVKYNGKLYTYSTPAQKGIKQLFKKKKADAYDGLRPCLLIKLNKKDIVKKESRTMRGRKL